ncbi:MAG TPA: hypothetical protein VGF95_05215 [Solirubrobacteraceae bacterium]|jgi:hypothetical protein
MGSAPRRGGLRHLALGFACTLAAIVSAASLDPGVASAALTWTPSPETHQSATGPLHLSCASSAFCLAVDAAGNGLASSNPGASDASWTPLTIAAGKDLTGVSCPTTTLCVAVDGEGDAYVSREPGLQPSWKALDIDGSKPLTAVSCPSASLCVAVDGEGDVLHSAEPTTSKWTSHDIDGSTPLTAVSCASASLCVAVDEAGNALTSSEPSSSNAWSSQPIAYEGAKLIAVSCEASGACTALDEDGYALTSANPTAHSTGPGNLGPTWSATRIDASAPLAGVSCISGLCAAIDEAGNALASESVLASPPAWSASVLKIGTGESLDGLSCIPLSICVAVAAPNATAGKLEAFTAPAPLPPPPPPKEISPSLPDFSPTLSGTPAVGQTLTCEPDLATGTTATIAYQWTANTKAVAGATNPKLKVKGKFEGDHVQCSVTATNAAGSVTKTTSYVSIPREVGPTAVGETKVSKASVGKGGVVSFTVECSPRAVGSCTIEAKLSVFERLRGTKVVAVSARRPAHARTAKTKTTHERTLTATIGSLKLQVAPGHDRKFNVPLNTAGKKLLGQRKSVPAKLTVSGTVIGVLKSKLSEARLTLGSAAKTAHSSTMRRPSARHPRS